MPGETFIITRKERQIVELMRMFKKDRINLDGKIAAERGLHLTEFSEVLEDTSTALKLLENLPLETENKRMYYSSAKGDIFPCWTIHTYVEWAGKIHNTTKLYMTLSDAKKGNIIHIDTDFACGKGALEFIIKTRSTKDNSQKREMRKEISNMINKQQKYPQTWQFTEETVKNLEDHYALWNSDHTAPLTTTYILPEFR